MFTFIIIGLVLGSEPELTRVGRMDAPELREVSGIVQSRPNPGVFWVHNDSGNPPALYAIRSDGTLLRAFSTTVMNLDWEDIATDDQGRLYVGDIGDNLRVLPVRTIYRFEEPHLKAPEDTVLSPTSSWSYRFPDGDRFDAEALVVWGDRAYLITKTHDRRPAEVFTLSIDAPIPLLRPATLERAGTLPGFVEPVTGADLSADGRWLAVCGLNVVRVYEVGDDLEWILAAEYRFQVRDQIEAICWDDFDLILAGERRGVYRLPRTVWTRGRVQEHRR